MTVTTYELDKKMLEYSISQYRTVPEYVALCKAFAVGATQIQSAVDYLSDMIDVDKAEGVWLDYIGWLVGETRNYQDAARFFSVNDSDLNVKKYFWFAQQEIGRIGTLTDILFRQRVKAKIAYNTSRCTRNENIKIIKNLTFADNVIIHPHTQFIDAGLDDQTKVYDKYAFAVIGSPEIDDEGIASGFSNSDYLNTKVALSRLKDKSWSVKANWTNKSNTDSPETNTLFYFGSSVAFGGVTYLTQSKKLQFVVRTGDITEAYSQETVAEKTFDTTPDYINARLSFNIQTGTYTASADWGEGEQELGSVVADTENKQLYVINTAPDNTILVGAGNGDTYNKNATDLKEFEISVNGNKIFFGTLDEPRDKTFTIYGSAEINEDGIASNLSSNTNYVGTVKSVTLLNDSLFDLKMKNVKPKAYVSGTTKGGWLVRPKVEASNFCIWMNYNFSFNFNKVGIANVDITFTDTDMFDIEFARRSTYVYYVYVKNTATNEVLLDKEVTVDWTPVLDFNSSMVYFGFSNQNNFILDTVDLRHVTLEIDGKTVYNGNPRLPMTLDVSLLGDNILDSNTLLDDVVNILGNGVGIDRMRIVGNMNIKSDTAGYTAVLDMYNAEDVTEGTDTYILDDGTYIAIPYRQTTDGHKVVLAQYRDKCKQILAEQGNLIYYTIDIENENYTLPV